MECRSALNSLLTAVSLAIGLWYSTVQVSDESHSQAALTGVEESPTLNNLTTTPYPIISATTMYCNEKY